MFKKLTFLPLLVGSILGLLGCIYLLIVYKFGEANPFYSFPQKLSILFCLAVALASIAGYRQYQNEGQLSFGEGIVVGSFANLVHAAIVSLAIFVYCQYIEPELVVNQIKTLNEYMIFNKENLIQSSSPELYAGSLKQVKNVNASSLAWDSLIWKMVQGIMFSILISLVLRRKAE